MAAAIMIRKPKIPTIFLVINLVVLRFWAALGKEIQAIHFRSLIPVDTGVPCVFYYTTLDTT